MSKNSIVIDVEARFETCVEPSARVCETAAMFGLGVDASRTIAIVPPMRLTLRRGQLLFITGASGGGKSTLLRLVREQLADRRVLSGRHRAR